MAGLHHYYDGLLTKIDMMLKRGATVAAWRQERHNLDGIKTFCMFMGQGRSGHSLIGSLLDAHPNAVIAHELNAVKYVRHGFRREPLFYSILQNSRLAAASGRIGGNRQSHSVNNQWQGRFESIHVIGDKRGESSVLQVRRRPFLIDRLRTVLGDIDLRVIHVVRNPFDMIASSMLKQRHDAEQCIRALLNACESVMIAKQQIDDSELYEFQHEEFVENPQQVLRHLCQFLNLDVDESYLTDCARIVHPSPHQTRCKVNWSDEQLKAIDAAMQRFPFLASYSFDGKTEGSSKPQCDIEKSIAAKAA